MMSVLKLDFCSYKIEAHKRSWSVKVLLIHAGDLEAQASVSGLVLIILTMSHFSSKWLLHFFLLDLTFFYF